MKNITLSNLRFWKWSAGLAALLALPLILAGRASAVVNVTKTGTDTTTSSTTQTAPGNIIEWVMSYGHTGPLGTMQLNDPIPAGSQYVPNSLIVPPGYTASFSTDGGGSYNPTDGGTATTHLRVDGPAPATETAAVSGIAQPPAAFSPGNGSGDGWNALFWEDDIYVINHHTDTRTAGGQIAYNQHIKCFDKSTGTQCAGFPTYASSVSGEAFGTGTPDLTTPTINLAEEDITTGRVYHPAARFTGTNVNGDPIDFVSSGVACVDLQLKESCGYTALTTFGPGANYADNWAGGELRNGRYYVVDGHSNVHCVTVATMAACGAPFPIKTDPAFVNSAFDNTSGPVAVTESFDGTHLFTNQLIPGGASTVMGCVDISLATPALCPGFPKTYTHPANFYFILLAPILDTSGVQTGICGASNGATGPGEFAPWTCFNLDGSGPFAAPFANQVPGMEPTGRGYGSPALVGSKLYTAHAPAAFGTATYACWDFAINNVCAGFTQSSSGAGVAHYSLREDLVNPGCIWEVGDAGIFEVFDADTGSFSCSRSRATVTAEVANFYCSGSGNVTNWSTVTINNIVGGTQYLGGGYVTLLDSNGNPVPGYNHRPLTAGEINSGVIDISALPISGLTTSLTASVELVGVDGSAWSDDGNPNNDPFIQLAWSGDDIQFCYETTVQACILGATGITNNAVFTTSDPTAADNPATATLSFPGSGCTPPEVGKVFNPTTALVDTPVTLTFNINNTSNLQTAGPWSVVDNLPGGMVVANPANGTTTCGNGAVTATPGSTSVTISGDFTGTTTDCTASVSVTRSVVGPVTNDPLDPQNLTPTNINPVDPPTTVTFMATPTISTTINANGYSDDVVIGSTGGGEGSLAWTLYGPVAPGVSGGCSDVSWVGAPTYETNTVATIGDVTVTTTPAVQPTAAGCYSYADTLTGEYFTAPAESPVGQPSETFIIAAGPSVTTTINADGYSDNITISGTAGFDGTLTWTLFGPVLPGVSGTCSDANWVGATTHDTDTVAVTDDGSLTVTPTTQPTAAGCYSYAVTLDGPNYSAPANSPVGLASETFSIQTTPTIQTTVNANGYSDDVVVTNTNGAAGTLSWTLHGPTNGGPAGDCASVTWGSVGAYETGTLATVGDGTYTLNPIVAPTTPGCYSYAVTLDGPSFTTPAVSVVGLASETFVVEATPSITTAIAANGFSDNITVTDSHNLAGTLTWTLLGPVSSIGGDCTGVSYVSAPTAQTGTIPVIGDNVYVANPTQPAGGCYTYEVTLDSPNYTAQAISPRGLPEESFQQDATATLTTTASINIVGEPPVASLQDSIVVAGTSNFPGTLSWTLVGPVEPTGDTCTGTDLSGAPIIDSGTIPVAGDGTYATTETPNITAVGCYGYNVELTGDDLNTVTSTFASPNEMVEMPRVPVTFDTVAVHQTVTPSMVTLHDTVIVTGSMGLPGNIHWRLYGPYTAASSMADCPGEGDPRWTNGPMLASGDMSFVGDGTYLTPETIIPTGGCYTFSEIIHGDGLETVESQPGVLAETVFVPTPTIQVKKTSDKTSARRGTRVTYTITVSNSDPVNPALNQSFSDDLKAVLDDAHYNNDASPSAGTATFSSPNINWNGTVPAGGSVTVTYSVTIKNPPTGDGTLKNVVTAANSNCQALPDPAPSQGGKGNLEGKGGKGAFLEKAFDIVMGTQKASAMAPTNPDCIAITAVDYSLAGTGQNYNLIQVWVGLASVAGAAAWYGQRRNRQKKLTKVGALEK